MPEGSELVVPTQKIEATSTATASTVSGSTPTASATTSATPEVSAVTPASTAGSATVVPTGTPVPTATATPTDQPNPQPTPSTTATTPGPRTFGPISLTPALGGQVFGRPLEVGAYPIPGRDGKFVFVADRTGIVRLYRLDTGEDLGVFLLNIAGQTRSDYQEGLLSLALDPDFLTNGHLWAWYTPLGFPRRMRLSRFTASRNVARTTTELVVLEVEEPLADHNGGAIRFGGDGLLYLSIGDGGQFADSSVAQDPGSLLGTVIRIDVSAASAAEPYRIPTDNPFLGTLGAAPEVFAYGFRNPWRMSFDAASGALLLGDVGEDTAEEVNIVRAGANYGWDRVEGLSCYSTAINCRRDSDVDPVFSYGHSGPRCSITGGVTYRGNAVPSLAGAYLFADYCSGEIWALDTARPNEAQLLANGVPGIVTFGLGPDGEVLIARFGEPLLTIVEAP